MAQTKNLLMFLKHWHTRR